MPQIDSLAFWKPRIAMLQSNSAWLKLPIPESVVWDPAFLENLSADGRDWGDLLVLVPDDWKRSDVTESGEAGGRSQAKGDISSGAGGKDGKKEQSGEREASDQPPSGGQSGGSGGDEPPGGGGDEPSASDPEEEESDEALWARLLKVRKRHLDFALTDSRPQMKLSKAVVTYNHAGKTVVQNAPGCDQCVQGLHQCIRVTPSGERKACAPCVDRNLRCSLERKKKDGTRHKDSPVVQSTSDPAQESIKTEDGETVSDQLGLKGRRCRDHLFRLFQEIGALLTLVCSHPRPRHPKSANVHQAWVRIERGPRGLA